MLGCFQNIGTLFKGWWFIMEKPVFFWFRGTTILGNIHISARTIFQLLELHGWVGNEITLHFCCPNSSIHLSAATSCDLGALILHSSPEWKTSSFLLGRRMLPLGNVIIFSTDGRPHGKPLELHSYLHTPKQCRVGVCPTMVTSSEVAYGTMGLFLCSCACGAVYIHFLARKKQNFG